MILTWEAPSTQRTRKEFQFRLIHLVENLYKKGNNAQFAAHNVVFIIKFQFLLHVSALFPAIIRFYV